MPSADIARATRGLKNRNPGNLRSNPRFTWDGQVGIDDKDFVVFASDVKGLRAAIIDLHTHYIRDKEVCVLTLIGSYAPPVENDTKSYIDFVCERLNVEARDTLAFDRRTADALIRAIVRIEQGLQPFDDATIAEAIEQAFAHFEAPVGHGAA